MSYKNGSRGNNKGDKFKRDGTKSDYFRRRWEGLKNLPIEEQKEIIIKMHRKDHKGFIKFLLDNRYLKEEDIRGIKELRDKKDLLIKQARQERKRRQHHEAREYAWEYKNNHICNRCGESDPSCLVFHHIHQEDKENNISKLYRYGIRKVKEEINKCEILCSNCHLKLHFEERKEGNKREIEGKK